MKKGEYSMGAQYQELSEHRSFEALGQVTEGREHLPSQGLLTLGAVLSGEPDGLVS